MVAVDSGDPAPEERFSTFVADFSFQDLPTEAVNSTTRAFTDTVGVAVAGTRTPVGRIVGRFDHEKGRRSVSQDALYFGAIGHALDYDDLSWGIDGHPSVVLVPPVLALAGQQSVSGRDAITAYVAGFEIACAIAAPISPEHYERGWHATATFGSIGAAASAAWLLNLDAERTRSALNVAASTPAGLKRNFGSMTKPLHAGFASRSGVTAALLAADGVTADARAISGEKGFWELYGDRVDDTPAIGEEWAIRTEGIHVKMYPCCYFAHSSVAAASFLASTHDIDPGNIDSVTVTASRGAADALQHHEPETGLEAKFSMEYTVASAIVRDRVGLEAFEDDAIRDDDVNAVRRLVKFVPDTTVPYDDHGATVEIETSDGVYEETRANPPGVHSNPPSESALETKFSECATRAISDGKANSLFEDLSSLPEMDRIDRISDVL